MEVHMQQGAKNLKKGFSIAELMVVILIIGLIATAVLYRVGTAGDKAKIATTKQTLKSIQGAIENFYEDVEEYPNTLEELVKEPQDERREKWQHPYLPANIDFKDPWKQKYLYNRTEGGDHEYELYSKGPKGGKRISVWSK